MPARQVWQAMNNNGFFYKMILQGRLNGKQKYRMKRLLDMMYSPKELANEIGISTDMIYRGYIPLGCPHERNNLNYILINGKQFLEWYEHAYKKIHLGKDETFCLTCKKGVKIVNQKQMQNKDLVYLLSACPICGRKLTKIIASKGRGSR
ncbi:MAG: hypothetical protein UZ14_CFX002000614 [Chloroflexi bacterium OLB14]|nr:MAG: hypothetical protein UZ14_CFX002000614 [Chloroflexi bacterium OLB14]